MNDNGDLHWPKINDYLLEIGTARTVDELFQRAVAGAVRIIPYDTAAGVFDVHRKALCSDGLSEREQKAYNEHYRYVQPPFSSEGGFAFPNPAFFSFRSGMFREHAGSEYYVDFAHPNRLEYFAMAPAPGRKVILSLNRSRRGPAFSDRETRILDVINAHLNNFHSILNKLAAPSGPTTAEELSERFPMLSRREVEISQFLCGTLSVPEIASRLMVSVRTVEAHVAHLYLKLEVRNRRAAVALLTGK